VKIWTDCAKIRPRLAALLLWVLSRSKSRAAGTQCLSIRYDGFVAGARDSSENKRSEESDEAGHQ